MKDTERRCLNTFISVREHGLAHPEQFPSKSFAADQFDILKEVIDGLEQHTGAQAAGMSAAREGSGSKAPFYLWS